MHHPPTLSPHPALLTRTAFLSPSSLLTFLHTVDHVHVTVAIERVLTAQQRIAYHPCFLVSSSSPPLLRVMQSKARSLHSPPPLSLPSFPSLLSSPDVLAPIVCPHALLLYALPSNPPQLLIGILLLNLSVSLTHSPHVALEAIPNPSVLCPDHLHLPSDSQHSPRTEYLRRSVMRGAAGRNELLVLLQDLWKECNAC
eukprot:755352-Hanusia_phi.AAC.3